MTQSIKPLTSPLVVEEATTVSMHSITFDGHDIQALVDMVSSQQRSSCKRKGHDKENCFSKKKLDDNKYTKRSSAFQQVLICLCPALENQRRH